ncbi:MAG TPA: HAD-IIA family hydrolase [Anaerolineae bacterium]|nr:HAD-IIA family hydrolase [Anaerolineae bacterium]
MHDWQHLRVLLLDMDGVLWRGEQPLGDLPRLFQRIASLNLRVALVTNNATRTPAQYVAKLQRFGVTFPATHIFGSAQAAVAALQQRFPQGAGVYLIGEEGLARAVQEAGFRLTEGNAQAVVVALDRHLTYEKLRRATVLIRQGALFIGTNPDRTYPTPEGLVPGAGAILAAVEAATDTAPWVVGKPAPLLFQLAMGRLDVRPEETLVVGDRLETDILGGQQAGCATALVLSGVTSEAQAKAAEVQPDLIVPDLEHLLSWLETQRRHPGQHIAQ